MDNPTDIIKAATLPDGYPLDSHKEPKAQDTITLTHLTRVVFNRVFKTRQEPAVVHIGDTGDRDMRPLTNKRAYVECSGFHEGNQPFADKLQVAVCGVHGDEEQCEDE